MKNRLPFVIFILFLCLLFIGCAAPPVPEPSKPAAVALPAVETKFPAEAIELLTNSSLTGDIQTVQELIKQGVNVNAKDIQGRNALVAAALGGHTEIVKLLLDSGADVNSKQDNGFTALFAASMNGHTETVSVLMAHGADVNAQITSGTIDSVTPLMIASFNGHTEIAKMLIEDGSAYVNAEESHNGTALMLAAVNNHSEIVALLLEHGANIADMDNYDKTALDYATEHGYRDVVDVLITYYVLQNVEWR